ncbi:hypothetical protein A607_0935 [Helicobacter pylori UMB_G1]|nr:hypothetical protein A607_0935 [Helicobacter pylori UMB_G1]
MVRGFFLFVGDIFDRILKILKTLFVCVFASSVEKLCSHQMLTIKPFYRALA